MELIINIDGFSPFKSSPLTIWPILCKVHTKEDIYKPFVVAVYAGSAKPKDATVYLKKFVKETNHLQSIGIDISDTHFHVTIKFLVCDSPARAFLKCIEGHTSFVGCERCKVIGHKVDRVTVFLETDAEKRTDEGFRRFDDPECHKDVSHLIHIDPPIDIVHQFILDPMHLVYLGVTKRLLEFLLLPSSNKVRLSEVMKTELKRRTKKIHQDIPDEYPRKMRSTNDFGKYKATEYKFFLLNAAPVVLKELVSDKIYEHFMLLTVACRLLSGEDALSHTEDARKHLKKFVEDAPGIYGESFVSLNVHNLIHLCDDIEYTKCNLNELGAWTFESHLGLMSRVLRSPTHVVAQLGRRIYEMQEFVNKNMEVQAKLEISMVQKGKILKLNYQGMILSTHHPNNTVSLEDGSIASIQEFCKDETIFAKIKKYMKVESIFDRPCDSKDVSIYEVSRLSSRIISVPLEKIKHKCIRFQMNFSPLDEDRCFVEKLMH